MPLYSWIQESFTAGVISPLLNARSEVDQRRKGLKEGINVVIDPRGPLFKRGGLVLAAEQYGATYIPVCEIPFVYSETPNQSYTLEFGYISSTFAGYIRVIYKAADDTISKVLVSSVPYSGTGITGTDPATNIVLQIRNIRYAQIGDIMFLVDGVHVMYELARTGTNQPGTWAISASSMTLPPWNELRNSMTYTFYNMPQAVWNANKTAGTDKSGHPNNENQMSVMFERPESTRLSTGNHLDYISAQTAGILWSSQLSIPWPSYITKTDFFGWKVESKLYVPETGIYTFGLNSAYASDLYVDGELIAYRYGWAINGNSPPTIETGDYGDTGQFIHTFTMAQSLQALSHSEIIARVVYSNNGYPGIQVGWRKESGTGTYGEDHSGSVITGFKLWRGKNLHKYYTLTGDPVATNPAPTAAYYSDYAGWDGDEVYEVKLTKTANDTFSLALRVVEDGVTADTAWASAETRTGIAWSTLVGTPCVLEISGHALNKSIIEGICTEGTPFSATFHDILAFGHIRISNWSSHAINDYWIFRVGCKSIPKTMFQRSEKEGISTSLYPRVVGFHEDRLILANSPAHPDSAWLSKSGQYRVFTLGANDDDSIQFTLSSGQPDPIQWAESTRFLMLGTASNIFVVKSNGAYLSPSDLDIKPYSALGSAMIKPFKVGSTIFFVERSKRIIRELSYDAVSESFGGRDLTVLCPHLFASDIREIFYLQSAILTKKPYPLNILLAVLEDGSLRVMTHEKDHEVAGWTTFQTEGTVESVSGIPAASGDALWILEKHTVASDILVNSTAVKTASYYGIKYLDPDKYEDDVLTILDGEYGTVTPNTITVPHMLNKSAVILTRPAGSGSYVDTSTHNDDLLFAFSAAGIHTLGSEYWTLDKDMKVCYVFPVTVTPMPLEIPVSSGTAKNAKKRIAECFVEMMDTYYLQVNGVIIDSVAATTVPTTKRITLAGWNEIPTLSLTQTRRTNCEIISISAKVAVNAY